MAHGRRGRGAPHRQVTHPQSYRQHGSFIHEREPLDPRASARPRLDCRAVPGKPATRGHVPHRPRHPRRGAAAAAHRAARAPRARALHPHRDQREAARDRELVPARRDVRRHARPVLRGDADRPRDRGHAQPRDLRRAEEVGAAGMRAPGRPHPCQRHAQGVTIIEVVGDVTEKLAPPRPLRGRAVLVQVPARGVG